MSEIITGRNAVMVARDRAILSWGSVLGGLFVAISCSWLLALFGSAIGLSIADASDADAIGAGFGIVSSIWLLVSFVVAYFIGGLVVGRLSGSTSEDVGMLHGVTMWGISVVLTALVGIGGISGIVQSGASAISAISAGSKNLASTVDIDSDAMDEVTNTAAFDKIRATAVRSIRSAAAEKVSETSDASISQRDASEAIMEIDSDVLVDMGIAIFNDEPERARNILAADTNLTDTQIKAVVENVTRETKKEIDELKANAKEAAEAASTYASATLWALFVAIALALIASIFGGRMGTSTVKRLAATR